MFADDLRAMSQGIIENYGQKGFMVATVESCTGGLISALLTDIPGSSAVVDRGFVTYTNEAKQDMVGVPADMLAEHGAVSEEVARAMAEGGIAHSRADVAVAVTGIAGPGGATETKPVGLVFIALAARDAETMVERHEFQGDRQQVRLQTATRALTLLYHFGA